jgi:pilus assembly protein Flp/PilA
MRMKDIVDWLYRWRIWQDTHGQDMVEFALLASLVAVASGLFLPGLQESMNTIYSRVQSKLIEAGG